MTLRDRHYNAPLSTDTSAYFPGGRQRNAMAFGTGVWYKTSRIGSFPLTGRLQVPMIAIYPHMLSLSTSFSMVMLAILILSFLAGLPGQKVWVTHRKHPRQADHPEAPLSPTADQNSTLNQNTLFSLSRLHPQPVSSPAEPSCFTPAGFQYLRTESSDTIIRRKCTWRA